MKQTIIAFITNFNKTHIKWFQGKEKGRIIRCKIGLLSAKIRILLMRGVVWLKKI